MAKMKTIKANLSETERQLEIHGAANVKVLEGVINWHCVHGHGSKQFATVSMSSITELLTTLSGVGITLTILP